jgi:hypothetical protein
LKNSNRETPWLDIVPSAHRRIFGRNLCLAVAGSALIALGQVPTLYAQTSLSSGIESSPANSELAAPSRPLFVRENSHVVVLEYEAWFGPNAVTFQTSVAQPVLQSADMQAIGGGYDSADPAVIKRHVEWMENMGIDAALIEVTNNVSCIFNSQEFAQKYLQNCSDLFRSENQSIRDNTGNLYPAWSKLGTRLKLIPMLGGIDQDVLYKDSDGKTAFEKELEYFGKRIEEHPDLGVIYEGKPLILIYLGASQDPTLADNPLWLQIRQFVKSHPELAEKYTFRMMAGYLDSQSDLWTSQGTPEGPVEINPEFAFWSWVDRLNTSCTLALCPYYPSFNKIGRRVENFTASIATAGQNGWGCPSPNELPYCPDDALRYGKNDSYETFDSFMAYARELKPIFLTLHQFNEFNSSDEGWDANTNDDIEPANQWGSRALEIVRDQIRFYRREVSTEGPHEFTEAP